MQSTTQNEPVPHARKEGAEHKENITGVIAPSVWGRPGPPTRHAAGAVLPPQGVALQVGIQLRGSDGRCGEIIIRKRCIFSCVLQRIDNTQLVPVEGGFTHA